MKSHEPFRRKAVSANVGMYLVTKLLVIALALAGACGGVSSKPDAANVDASSDATSARCDVTKPFGPPVPVGGVNTNSDDIWGWLSADQLTIYFARNGDLYYATRTQPTGAFTGVASLGGVNTANSELRPVLTADGLTLFMEIGGTGGYDIHVATRTSTAATFSAHVPVAGINTTSVEQNPWISDDGLVMYLCSDRAGTYDIFKTARASTSSPFSTPVAVGELNTMANDVAPIPSQDGLEIFFASNRDQGGPNPVNNIYHATRLTPSDGFGTPTLVVEVSGSISDDVPNWVSPDRCQLIFTSSRVDGSGGNDIWITTRPQ